MFVYRFRSLLFVLLLALAGCAPTPTREQPPVEDPLRRSADNYAVQGDYIAAAQLYLGESKTAPQYQRPGLRLIAGEYLAQGGLWDQLAEVLASIDPQFLDPALQADYLLLNAALALGKREAEQALERLQEITNPELLPDQGQGYYRLRADAYAMTGNAIEAARQLIWLDGLLLDQQEKLENQYQIWGQLSGLSDQSLRQFLTSPPPDTLSGWIELVLITRQYRGDQQHWTVEIDSWRARYPSHAAESALLPELLHQVARFGTRARHIAVLLPLTGRAAESAAAIRDGIMAAYFEDKLEQPELRFYDTGGNPQLLWSVYQQAVQDGAEFVVGPLLKDSIQQLALSAELPVPVLALNQTETEPLSDTPLYQFGLAPEDEARQAAEKAFFDGHRQVVALVPESAWGRRVLSAFDTRFHELGGQIMAVGHYATKGADFKEPIQHTLNLDASKRRHLALERLMGQKLDYEPRRRQDVEAIFLLGFPKQARLIRPQLRFHRAGDLPVYSTSHVFGASSNAALDRDMDGLLFCDIPWVLDKQGRWFEQRNKLESLWPNRSRRHQRLFALGFDAYQVIPWLDTLSMPGFSDFPGATGLLTLDQNKQMHRALGWAQFEGGLPQNLMPREGHREAEEDWRSR